MRVSWIFILPIVGILSSCLKDNAVVDQTGPQYIKDTTAIGAYLKQNNIAAVKMSQGIWFIIDSAGNGIRPNFSDSIKVRYSLKQLADLSLVSQSTQPKHFVLDSLLVGIQVALPEFQAGSKGRIFLPSFYSHGYGYLFSPSNLIYEFQLTEVKDYQLKFDTATIDTYLNIHSISAVKDKSGLRYSIDTLKTGVAPLLSDEVQVNYVAKNLSDGSTLDQGTSVTFPVSGLILGWQIGLQKMQEGSTFSFYVLSSLAYGPNGNGGMIKANTNLIFNVKLLKVIHH